MMRSLFEKVWQRHVVVAETDDAPAILYIDLHLVHEVTSPDQWGWLERIEADGDAQVDRPVAV